MSKHIPVKERKITVLIAVMMICVKYFFQIALLIARLTQTPTVEMVKTVHCAVTHAPSNVMLRVEITTAIKNRGAQHWTSKVADNPKKKL